VNGTRISSLEPLGSERDQNFLAYTSDGDRYVLKFANSAEPAAVTDFQNQALLHIARVAPDIPVPRVIPANDGKLMFEVESAAGDPHRVRLLSWLEGVPLQHAQGVSAVARQMGDCLAQIGLALREFEHPAGDYALLWDIRNAASLEKLLPHVDDRDLRTLCEQRLSRFRDVIAPQLDTLRSQVIHNDMNPSNVLVDDADVNRVTGVIDFRKRRRSRRGLFLQDRRGSICGSRGVPGRLHRGSAVDGGRDCLTARSHSHATPDHGNDHPLACVPVS
jgi:Ser/Thr protein kinase RdoA (MazF antagonist)